LEESLAASALFGERFIIEVRARNEVLAIDRTSPTVSVRDLETGREYSEPYDALVLSPGAAPSRFQPVRRVFESPNDTKMSGGLC
jgi:NADPH-dependent 2,4-dienoyl-CoA reductase/sulfur reductase-like enzyme